MFDAPQIVASPDMPGQDRTGQDRLIDTWRFVYEWLVSGPAPGVAAT